MKVINNILENIIQLDETEYTYISVRLKPEYYYMLDLLASLNNSSIGSVFTEEISNNIMKIISSMMLDNIDNEKFTDEIISAINSKEIFCSILDNMYDVTNAIIEELL